MRTLNMTVIAGIFSLCFLGCGGGSGGGTVATPPVTASAPTVASTAEQNGAVLVSLASSTFGATLYYTIDGTTPTASSLLYASPFLVGSNLAVKAVAVVTGDTNSSVTSQAFDANIPSDTLIWSDEFANTTSNNAQPNPLVWGYETGGGGWGNSELEDYCAWNSSTSPCDPANPNAYVGTDGYLHIVLQQPAQVRTRRRA